MPVSVWWWPLFISYLTGLNKRCVWKKIGRHSCEVNHDLIIIGWFVWPCSDKWLFTGLEWAKTNASNTPGMKEGCSQHSAKGRFCLWAFVLRMKILSRLESFLFSEGSPLSLSRESKLIEFIPAWDIGEFVHDDGEAKSSGTNGTSHRSIGHASL